MISCDICEEKITSEDEAFEENGENYQIIECQGKHLLCDDCIMALGEYLTSDECKKMCKDHRKKVEQEMGIEE